MARRQAEKQMKEAAASSRRPHRGPAAAGAGPARAGGSSGASVVLKAADMCGIVGYVGPRQCVDLIVGGLRKLEYRGYDSAGVAVVGPAGSR